MKVVVKRVRGGVVIKLGLRHARNLMSILDYSHMNDQFEARNKAAFESAEIVSHMLYDKFKDANVQSFT